MVVSIGNNNLWVPAIAREGKRVAVISLPFDLFPGSNTDVIPFIGTRVPAVTIRGAATGLEHHATLDLPESVNPGTLQQTGDLMLSLVRALGAGTTLDSIGPELTYFPILGRLVHYPVGRAVPLAVAAGLCFLVTVVFGLRFRRLTRKGLGLGFLVSVVGLLLSVAVVILLWLVIQVMHPEYLYSSYRPHLSDDNLYIAGFLFAALAVTATCAAMARRRIAAIDLAAGVLVIWFPAVIAAAFLVPATSFLATWVLLSGSLALLWALVVDKRRNARVLSGVGFLVSAALASLIWLPTLVNAIASGPMGSGNTMLGMLSGLAVLWILALLPVVDFIANLRQWLLPATAALVGSGFLVAGHFLVGRHSPPPMVNPIGYWLNADSNEALWVAFIGGTRADAHTTAEVQVAFPTAMDERQTQIRENPVRRPYVELFPEAPPFSVPSSEDSPLALDGPRMDVLADGWVEDERIVDLRFTTSMVDRLYVIVPDSSLRALAIPNNERIELTGADDRMIRLDGMPGAGMETRLVFSEPGPVGILLVEEKTGLPAFPGLQTKPPPGTMQSPGEFLQGVPSYFTAIYRPHKIP